MKRQLAPSKVSSLLSGLALVALMIALPGCMLIEALNDRDGAVVVDGSAASLAALRDSCALRGFFTIVHPQLKTNCGECHSGTGPGVGSFASPDLLTAYNASTGRTNFVTPAASLLIQRSANTNHGGQCASCGSEWADSLEASLTDWSRAAEDDPEICSTLPFLDDEDLEAAPFVPPTVVEVEVIPAGLAEFSRVGGLYEEFRTNCLDCHVPGDTAAFAPLAHEDATTAYRAAKLRANFANPELSRIINRASNINHGDGCAICGDSALITRLTDRISDWAALEDSGAASLRINLADVPVSVRNAGDSATLTWDLGAEVTPANSNLAGATFSIDIEIQTVNPFVYRLSNPRISTGSRAIRARSLMIRENGVENPLLTIFKNLDVTVPAGSINFPLSSSIGLVPIADSSTDDIGFSFRQLE
jgi:mono/diheme cytochrome c family protein